MRSREKVCGSRFMLISFYISTDMFMNLDQVITSHFCFLSLSSWTANYASNSITVPLDSLIPLKHVNVELNMKHE